MTGMEKIGASYKYLRKSPSEAKRGFFELPSGWTRTFLSTLGFLKTLLFRAGLLFLWVGLCMLLSTAIFLLSVFGACLCCCFFGCFAVCGFGEFFVLLGQSGLLWFLVIGGFCCS